MPGPGAGGNAGSQDEARLVERLYRELHALAGAYMRAERTGHTLQTTALVHEAYLRLGKRQGLWESENHFMRTAARTMRRVLVDHARRKRAAKKGGTWKREPLDPVVETLERSAEDLLCMDEALDRLAATDPRLARVVEFRFFCGFTVEETARALGVSKTTVKEDWSLAKAWLRRAMAS